MYAVMRDNEIVVKTLLKRLPIFGRGRRKILESRIRRKGYNVVGITGMCDTLILAMSLASPSIVSALLEAGADISRSYDINGNHAFEFGCALSRVENLKLWMQRIPDWDINTKNRLVGGTALNLALFMGNGSSIKMIEFLLQCGASIEKAVTNGGATAIMSLAQNESGDPSILKLLLDHGAEVNALKKPITLKFKILKGLLRFLLKFTKSEVMDVMTRFHYQTALYMATARGDTDFVRTLLKHNASVKRSR